MQNFNWGKKRKDVYVNMKGMDLENYCITKRQ